MQRCGGHVQACIGNEIPVGRGVGCGTSLDNLGVPFWPEKGCWLNWNWAQVAAKQTQENAYVYSKKITQNLSWAVHTRHVASIFGHFQTSESRKSVTVEPLHKSSGRLEPTDLWWGNKGWLDPPPPGRWFPPVKATPWLGLTRCLHNQTPAYMRSPCVTLAKETGSFGKLIKEMGVKCEQ